MQHIATSQLVYIEIQLTCFCVMQAFTKGFFRKDFKTAVVLFMPLDHSLGMIYVFLIMYASMKSRTFQLFGLSVAVALFLMAIIKLVPVEGIIINIK